MENNDKLNKINIENNIKIGIFITKTNLNVLILIMFNR